MEFKYLLKDQNLVLRWVNYNESGEWSRQITGSFKKMKKFVKPSTPFLWETMRILAKKKANNMTEMNNSKESLIVLNSILALLYVHNQQANAYQTMIGVFYYSTGMQRPGIDVVHSMAGCVSYSNLLKVMHELRVLLLEGLRTQVATKPMLLEIDNLDKKLGVQDGGSNYESSIVNCTGGFAIEVRGVEDIRRIPRTWRNAGARLNLKASDI